MRGKAKAMISRSGPHLKCEACAPAAGCAIVERLVVEALAVTASATTAESEPAQIQPDEVIAAPASAAGTMVRVEPTPEPVEEPQW